MGRVYLAFTAGGRPVALKVMRPDLGEDAEFRARFQQEVTAARRVHGMYTAQVLDADPDGSPPWLATAYVDGPSLQQAVEDNGPLPEGTVWLLMAGVAEALTVIHAEGVIHRDLKPSNVLLGADGPRVIDFGIARAAEATALTHTGIRVGTPQFMAPEQVGGDAVTPAADVFALGALTAYAVLGRSPFGEGSPVALLYRIRHERADLDGCPAPLRGLIERCLAKAPGDRPTPGQIIAECRAQTSGQRFSAWLPPAAAVGAAQQRAPDVPSERPTVASGDPSRQPAPWPDQDSARTAGGRRGQSWRRPSSVVAGAAAVAVIAAVATTVLLSQSAHGTGRGNLTAPRTPATSSPRPASSQSAQSAGASPSVERSPARPVKPSPTPSPTLDACVVGTWQEVTDHTTLKVNGTPVVFTSHGVIQDFEADGTEVADYGNGIIYTGTLNGNLLTLIVKGSASEHYQTTKGELLSSHIVSHLTGSLYTNLTFNETVRFTLDSAAELYSCSGNTLTESTTDGVATVVLTRT
jgi:eukaryotic-like serine/threonine-protein kinase